MDPISEQIAWQKRLKNLWRAWVRHCKAKHPGTDVKYDLNLGATFIICCAPKCKWEKEIPRQ